MKQNRKWKIPHTVIQRRTLHFSSYKNHKLKIKTDELELVKGKEGIFCNSAKKAWVYQSKNG